MVCLDRMTVLPRRCFRPHRQDGVHESSGRMLGNIILASIVYLMLRFSEIIC